jgi:glycosyltransferase involved in cell wall biosynthesis
VVHVHFLRDWPVASHSQRCGIPLVISTWGSDVIADEHCELDTADTREVKVGLLRSADAVTATTLFLADETARYGRIDRSKIRVIPFGVEVKRFDQLSALAGCTIGFVKHLESKYGLEVLLKAMPAIRKRVPNVRLVVVGDGARRDRLHHLARQNGLEDCIDWRGAIPHEDVPRVLSGFDVLAMPSMSRSETFGVSAIEAQAAGVPVVASDWPGVREAVLHDCGGLLVPAGDVGSLTDALVRVLTDEGLRQRMGRDGRSFVLERFDFERNIDAMVQVYEEVAATCPADIY